MSCWFLAFRRRAFYQRLDLFCLLQSKRKRDASNIAEQAVWRGKQRLEITEKVNMGETTSVVKRATITNRITARLGRAVQNLEKAFSFACTQSLLVDKLRTARREALDASAEALRDFMTIAKIDSAGLVVSHLGSARLIVQRPRGSFRNAASAAGLIQYKAIDTRSVREYPMMDFQIPSGHPASKNADAQRIYCVAAGIVMQRHFPLDRWIVELGD
jgi:hypothetical protein